MEVNGTNVNIAIRELYRLILVVDEETRECKYLDYDREVMNLPYDPDDYDQFCDELRENIHPGDRGEFFDFSDSEHVKNALAENPFVSIECRLKLYDKRYYWNEITFCRVKSESGEFGQFLLLIRDVHEKKVRNLEEIKDLMNVYADIKEDYAELFEENMRDIQTGCYNRKGLKYYTDKAICDARDRNLYMFVCVLDLNGLKHINDTYGHDDGDVAISEIAKELLANAPKNTYVVRTGGDEFLVFGAMDPESDGPDRMCEGVQNGLDRFNDEHDYPYAVGVSYGWVLLPIKEDMNDLDEYVEIADSKMYEMKRETDIYIRD